jgi:hypothetical protein
MLLDVLWNLEGARVSWSSCWRPAARVAAAGDGVATWRGGENPVGSGERRAGEPGGGVRAARGSWQHGRSPARGGGRCSRAAERKGERGR